MNKYEEALERAKKLHDGFEGYDANRHIIEEIFPELNESEDERIRKWLIDYFDNVNDEVVKENRLKIIAYLEKQKEASKAIEAVERIDRYIDEHTANAHDMKDSNPDKKYYRGWDDALGKMSWILQDIYSKEKQKEQKPAEWSEEDTLMQTVAIQTLERFEGRGTTGMQIDWLKSLPERFNLLSKQEWSDEDEKHKQAIIDAIQIVMEECGDAKSIEEYQKDIIWFENRFKFRPQPHWKPSKEQMQWLESAVKLSTDKPYIHGIIISLYEQLRRL